MIINKRAYALIFAISTGLYSLLAALLPTTIIGSSLIDEIAYINIAKLYANADFTNAINGFWPPLSSMLCGLVFAVSGEQSVELARMTSHIFAVFYLAIVTYLACYHLKNKLFAGFVAIGQVPVVLAFSHYLSADILTAGLILILFHLLSEQRFIQNYKMAVFTGFIAAIGYLTKTFLLFLAPTFIVATMLYLILALPETKKKVLKKGSISLIVFALFAGMWSGILTAKYGEMTIGANGKYNIWIQNPKFASIEKNVHLSDMNEGVLPIPYKGANSFLDDPIKAMKKYENVIAWHPLSSLDNFSFFIKKIGNRKLFQLFPRLSIISPLFIGMICLMLFLAFYEKRHNDRISLLLIYLMLSGLLVIEIFPRHIIACFPIAVIFSCSVIERYFEQKRPILSGLFILLFAFMSFAPSLAIAKMNLNVDQWTLKKENLAKKHANIAASPEINFYDGMHFCLTNNCSFLGRLKPMSRWFSEINQHQIDYLLAGKRNKICKNTPTPWKRVLINEKICIIDVKGTKND